MSRDVGISLVLAALAFIIAAWLTQRLSNPASWLYKLDHPNPRSLHCEPIPRGGGLAILAAILISGTIDAGIYGVSNDLVWLAVAALLVAGISFLDDWRTIGLGSRAYSKDSGLRTKD